MSHVDPTAPDTRADDNQAKRALFLEAKDILDDKGVFMLAVRALRIRWYGEFLDTIDRDKERDLKARLKVLDAIPAEIKRFVSDYSVTLDRQRKNAGRA